MLLLEQRLFTDAPVTIEYQAALLDDDNHSIHSAGSGRTQSTAGFSLATKYPAGSYQGGTDYYRDTIHTRATSRATLGNFPSMPSFGYPGAPGSNYGGPPTSEFGYGGGNQASMASFGVGSQNLATLPRPNSTMSMGGPQNYGSLPRPISTMSMGGGFCLPRPNSTMSFGYGGGFPTSTSGVFPTSPSGVNPFSNPTPTPAAPVAVSESSDPTEAELVETLKAYLAGQDLVSAPPLLVKLNADSS